MKKIMIMLAFLMLVSGAASADQLLTNSGFEAGDLSGWTIGWGDIYGGAFNPSQGSNNARFFYDGGLSQKVQIVPGTTYSLTGDVFVPSGGSGTWTTWLTLEWLKADSSLISKAYDIVPSNSTRDLYNSFASGDKTAPSNAKYANVSMGVWQGGGTPPNPTDWDNFALNGQPIPEPASMLLLGSGLVGLFGVTRKKRS